VVISHIPPTPGITGMEATLRQHHTWPNLKKDVEPAVKNCHECQIGKKVRNKYGDLPERLAERPIAWSRVDVDLIGTFPVVNTSGKAGAQIPHLPLGDDASPCGR
jgi:hypothetical protein